LNIGIDFDNTIADYNNVFAPIAKKLGFLNKSFNGGKSAVSRAIKSQPNGEKKWQTLQGQVYGKYLWMANLMPGADTFLKTCKNNNVNISIVSHKTKFGHYDISKTNLHDVAVAWMENKEFFTERGFKIKPRNIIFAKTQAEKIFYIKNNKFTYFIDDLPEVLDEVNLSPHIKTFLFAKNRLQNISSKNWMEINEIVFG